MKGPNNTLAQAQRQIFQRTCGYLSIVVYKSLRHVDVVLPDSRGQRVPRLHVHPNVDVSPVGEEQGDNLGTAGRPATPACGKS